MPTYCTDTRITEELMNNLPSEISAAYRTTQIADASAEVDALAGSNFPLAYSSSSQRFPNITDSPATPVLIEKCTIWLACSYIWTTIYATTRFSGDGESETPAERYRRYVTNRSNTGMLDKVRSGELQIVLSDGTVLGISEDPALGIIEYSEENRTNIMGAGRYDSEGQVIGDFQVLDDF